MTTYNYEINERRWFIDDSEYVTKTWHIQFEGLQRTPVIHRDGGNPAKITLRERDGSIQSEVWYSHGMMHREDGPALKEYDKNGNVVRSQFYLFGREILLDRLIEQINDPKIRKKLISEHL